MKNKAEVFERLFKDVEEIMAGEETFTAKLQRVCDKLARAVPYYNWVGFYIADPAKPDELALGPYHGAPTDHVRIPFGAGVCGRAATTRKLFVVQDVSKETNYLSCSPDVKAEIVLPIFHGGAVWGELDIDSHRLAPFSSDDGAFLGKICSLVAAHVSRD